MAGPQDWGAVPVEDGPAAWGAQPVEANGFLDALKSIPRGMVKGFSDAASAAGKAGALETQNPEMADQIPSGEEGTKLIEQNATGVLHQPQTPAGKYGEAAGEFLGNPASYIGPGSLPAKALTAATAGIGSQAGADLTNDSWWGKLAGAVLGGGVPRVAARAITPFPLAPERQAAVNTLHNEGVYPTAGQTSGNKALRYAESTLGDAPGAGGAATRAYDQVNRQFTDAVLSRAVRPASSETLPETVDRAFDEIGNGMDAVAARNSGRVDDQYLNDLGKAEQDYRYLWNDPLRKPIVENVIEHQLNQAIANGGALSGEQYKAIRSQLGKQAQSYRYKDPDVAQFLRRVQSATDDMMQRNMPPQDVAEWQNLRNRYNNLMTIEPASVGAGENAVSNISPAKLRQAAVAQDRRAYARGQGDFADLSRAGNMIMTPLPNSGTAQRWMTEAIPAAIGAGLGAAHGGAAEGLMATGPALAAPGIAGRALMSSPVQEYLKNQFATPIVRALPSGGSTAFRSGAASLGDILSNGGNP